MEYNNKTHTLVLDMEKIDFYFIDPKEFNKYPYEILDIRESPSRNIEDIRYDMIYYFLNTKARHPKKCYINCCKIVDDKYYIKEYLKTYFDKLFLWKDTELLLCTDRSKEEIMGKMILGYQRVGEIIEYSIISCKPEERDPYYDERFNKCFQVQSPKQVSF